MQNDYLEDVCGNQITVKEYDGSFSSWFNGIKESILIQVKIMP